MVQAPCTGPARRAARGFQEVQWVALSRPCGFQDVQWVALSRPCGPQEVQWVALSRPTARLRT